MGFDAAILDVDGVITRTALIHERAWKQLLDEALRDRQGYRPFSHEDYRDLLDGRPREEGLGAFLGSRGIDLRESERRDLLERKNRIFHRLLQEEGVEVFEDAVRRVRDWRRHGLGIAFVSASRNARFVLQAAGVDTLGDVRVDGEIGERLGLLDKASLFRHAARELDVEPSRAVAVEDAVAGVQAASREGFGLVIGVARTDDAQPLLDAGAHRVVRSLDEVTDLTEPGTRAPAELPSATRLDALDARLGHLETAIFLDFDGTLSPIVDRPDDAALPDETRELLRRLASLCTVAIVSGRGRPDVARRVGLDGLWIVGSHGFDVADPQGGVHEEPTGRAALPELDAAHRRLEAEIGGIAGVVLERKRFGLAAHYRLAPQATAQVTSAVRRVADESPHLRMNAGKRVVELVPDVDWHKGRAVERLLGLLSEGGRAIAPVYVGDDLTDEYAFRALKHRGLTVIVGRPRRPTHADLRLDLQADVPELLRQLIAWLEGQSDRAGWLLRYEGWSPNEERLREALCTLGNGHFATRGAAEEARAGVIHYPGTYLAGGYDRIATEIRGEVLVNEDLVNWPNWLPLTFRPAGGEWLSLERAEVLELSQVLDLRRGLLRRHLRVRDAEGRITRVVSHRFVSMHDPHVAALRWELTPENWSGTVEIRSSLDGTVRNGGVDRYGALRGEHLVPLAVGKDHDEMWLEVRTRQSAIRMAQVARTQMSGGEASRRTDEYEDRVDQTLALAVEQGRAVQVEKIVLLYSSRDHATSEPLAEARARIGSMPGFDALLRLHALAWARIWDRGDIALGVDHEEATRILRLHMFHLMQVASPHTVDRDVGIPARGLHGEAYRGHVFWDELFIFPYLNYAWPELTRELMMYRYRRLDAARAIARALGAEGAAWPWQSGSDGREESQVLHLNPRSGRWVPDETARQRHIGAAVAHNVWQYFEATGDHAFLATYGAEMLVETARFWASIAEWDESLDRWRIRGVVGPDEFHTRMPGSDRPGLDDNAYTNVMAAWCLRTAERALDEIGEQRRRELLDELQITDEHRQRWQDVASRLHVPMHDGRIISQFAGYDELEELDWEGLRKRHGDIQRLDRILEAEGDDPNRFKASKQADVLMLFYLFSSDELVELLMSMGVEFDPSWIADNVDYYLSRTSHGSTLSRVVHSWVLARSDRARSWQLFEQALRSDVSDIQGGTTSEGIHLGAMAGTVDLAQRGYTGAVIRDGVLWLAPRLPDLLTELRTRFFVRGAWIEVRVGREAVEVVYSTGWASCARIGAGGRIHELARGERRRFPLGG